MTQTNMKPADELLSVRQKIKALQEREKELKAGIQSGEMSMDGDFAIATLTTQKRKRFDRKAAEEVLGSLAEFDLPQSVVVLKVEELVGELVE